MAWEDTLKYWDIATKELQSYPKARVEEGQTNESFHRSAGKRRASHQSTEHELEVFFLGGKIPRHVYYIATQTRIKSTSGLT